MPTAPVNQKAERRKAQQALARSESELAAVFENAPVRMIVIDQDRKVRRANRAAREELGEDGKIEDRRGGEALRCVHALDDPRGCGFGPACESCSLRRLIIDTLQAGTSHHREEQRLVVDREGGNTTIHVLVSCIRLSLGGHPHALAMLEDITRRKRMEAELRQRDAELAHLGRLSTMGEMAAGLAHELNQPLYAICNYATGIKLRAREAAADPEGLGQMMEKIAGQARRASEIIRRLRNVVRKRQPRRASTDMNGLLLDLLKLVEDELRKNSIAVDLQLGDNLPRVFADGIQIQQAALNLVRNAVDAMLGVSADQRQLTLATSLVGGQAVEVAVADSGIGLAEEVQPQVFSPFFTTKAEGLGMGLAISRTIVEAHEGRIWATPNSPHGTVFRFVLPIGKKD